MIADLFNCGYIAVIECSHLLNIAERYTKVDPDNRVCSIAI